jgi:hypothetical protein
VDQLVQDGVITEKKGNALVRAAAESDVGKQR